MIKSLILRISVALFGTTGLTLQEIDAHLARLRSMRGVQRSQAHEKMIADEIHHYNKLRSEVLQSERTI